MTMITGRESKRDVERHGPSGASGPGMPDPGQTTAKTDIPRHTILGSRYRQAQAATAEYDEKRRTDARIAGYNRAVKTSQDKTKIASSNRINFYRNVINGNSNETMRKARMKVTAASEKINSMYTPFSLTASPVDRVIKDSSAVPIQGTGSASSLLTSEILVDDPKIEKTSGNITVMLIAAAVLFFMLKG